MCFWCNLCIHFVFWSSWFAEPAAITTNIDDDDDDDMMMMVLQGTVIIIANHGERIDIPPGAILENKIVSGNLRILDH